MVSLRSKSERRKNNEVKIYTYLSNNQDTYDTKVTWVCALYRTAPFHCRQNFCYITSAFPTRIQSKIPHEIQNPLLFKLDKKIVKIGICIFGIGC